jgi:predicted MFS family arabinose efflux permease
VSLWIAVAGPAMALLSCAVLGSVTLVAAVLLAPAGRPAREPPRAPTVLGRPGVRTLVTVHLSYMVCMGAMWVLVPAFATEAGHPDLAGLLVTVWSLGSAAGGLVLYLGGADLRRRPAYVLLLGLLTVSSVPLALTTSLWQFGFTLVAFGLGLAPWLAVADGLLAGVAPPPRTGEAYGWLMTAGQAGLAIGSAVTGVLADQRASGPPFLFVTAALAIALTIAISRRTTLDRA